MTPTSEEFDIQRLLDENMPGLILYARQWFASAAEDVVQDAFLRLLRETPPPKTPKAWLYRVVRNAAIDRQRKESRFRQEPVPDWFDGLARQPEPMPTWDGEDLTRALKRLEPDQREIVVSKIWGGLAFREIAELTGQPTSSVHHDYRQALDRLRLYSFGPNGKDNGGKRTEKRAFPAAGSEDDIVY